MWQLDARTLWARDATVASEQTAEFLSRVERRSPGSITSRVQCVVRVFVRQPQKGNLEEATIKYQAGRIGGRPGFAYGAEVES